MRHALKTKLVTLGLEARVIKRLEQKIKRNLNKRKAAGKVPSGTLPSAAFFSLKDHRRFVVRPEARSTHLAYGFLRGVPYSVMEGPTTRTPPDWSRVESIAERFSSGNFCGRPTDGDNRPLKDRLKEWRDGRPAAATAEAA